MEKDTTSTKDNSFMKKRALLIGINDYSPGGLCNLNFALQDAESFGTALKSYYGFKDEEITLMTCKQNSQLSPSEPESILNQLIPSQYKDELDLFIFGFWGHGIWINKSRYLCLKNTNSNQLEQTGLAMPTVINRIARLPIRNACLFLDCCQNRIEDIPYTSATNVITEEECLQRIAFNLPRDITLRHNLPDVENHIQSMAILNSCKKGQSAYEWGERQHGIFTAHLLDAMKEGSDSVTALADYIGNRVSQTAQNLVHKDQTPYYSLEGSISFPPYTGPKKTRATNQTNTIHTQPDNVNIKGVEALKQLMKLYQDSLSRHENENISNVMKTKCIEMAGVLDNLNNYSEDDIFKKIQNLARNTTLEISKIRERFAGNKGIFVSYAFENWRSFAQDSQQLAEVTRDLESLTD